MMQRVVGRRLEPFELERDLVERRTRVCVFSEDCTDWFRDFRLLAEVVELPEEDCTDWLRDFQPQEVVVNLPLAEDCTDWLRHLRPLEVVDESLQADPPAD